MSWTIDRFVELTTGYWPACVMSAAVELGLFDVLDGKGASAVEASSRLGTAQRNTEELLNALTALEVLEKRSESGAAIYKIKPSAAQFLTRSGSFCILDALKYNSDLYPLWGRLASSVKSGSPVIPPGAHLGGDPARTRRFTMGMHSRALAMSPSLIPSLDMKGRSRLLDIACGPGTFSSQLADRYLGLQVTLFDLPPILAVAKELAAVRASASRISFHSGDYHIDKLPGGHDAVLFSGALHQEKHDDAVNLMKKIYDAMEPGGRLFVVDMMLQSDRTAPAFSVLFSINMMLTSPAGRVYCEDEVRQILAETGFEDTTCKRLTECPYWVVIADKPPISRSSQQVRQD